MRHILALFAALALFAWPASATQVFVTTSGTWTVPYDMGLGFATSVECIGAAGNSAPGIANTQSGATAGSGAYSKITNPAFPIGAQLTVAVALPGSQAATSLTNAQGAVVISCDFGRNASGTTLGTSGLAASSIGTLKNSGANGRSGTAGATRGGVGGSSGAGPGGIGANGGNASATAGSGAGGTDGGVQGGAAGTNVGGIGANNAALTGVQCTGGTTSAVPSIPTNGAGGCGGASSIGVNGSIGSIEPLWDSTHGPGSGGGGAGIGGNGGDCRGYGSTGGSGGDTATVGGAAGASCQGILAINYTPAGRSAMMMGMGS